jgi:hypothetical protein
MDGDLNTRRGRCSVLAPWNGFLISLFILCVLYAVGGAVIAFPSIPSRLSDVRLVSPSALSLRLGAGGGIPLSLACMPAACPRLQPAHARPPRRTLLVTAARHRLLVQLFNWWSFERIYLILLMLLFLENTL